MTTTKYGDKERSALKEMFTRYKQGRPQQVPKDAEIEQLIVKAERTGLDPFARMIYGTWRGGKWSVEATIDGFRAVAESTGDYAGQGNPEWCDDKGNWHDVWLVKQKPAAARISAKKVIKGILAETPGVAHWSEYAVTGPAGQMWDKMPAGQLVKCAEALALRKAFPRQLGGLYTADEMAQAENGAVDVVSEANRKAPEASPQPTGDDSSPETTNDTRTVLSDDQLAQITSGLKVLLADGTKVGDLGNLFGAAGIGGPSARSKKAIFSRLQELTPDEAQAFLAEVEKQVEAGLKAEAEKPAEEPKAEPEAAPEDLLDAVEA